MVEKNKALKQKRKVKVFRDAPYYNLCSMCDDATNCRYAKSPESVILFCDEFEGYKLEEPEIRFKESRKKSHRADKTEKLIGLCGNCEKRD